MDIKLYFFVVSKVQILDWPFSDQNLPKMEADIEALDAWVIGTSTKTQKNRMVE